MLLYEEDSRTSTLRAELNRLRHLLGDELLGSRPYRLTAELNGDWLAVEAHLALGDVGAALRRYRGPLLRSRSRPGWCGCARASRRRCVRPCSAPASRT